MTSGPCFRYNPSYYFIEYWFSLQFGVDKHVPERTPLSWAKEHTSFWKSAEGFLLPGSRVAQVEGVPRSDKLHKEGSLLHSEQLPGNPNVRHRSVLNSPIPPRAQTQISPELKSEGTGAGRSLTAHPLQMGKLRPREEKSLA